MKISSPFKNGIITGLAFFSTVTALSIGYATLSSGLSIGDKVGTGSGLSSGSWNKIIDSIVELDGRTFELTSSGGNIGIGTASPSATLEVNGGLKVSGDVNAGPFNIQTSENTVQTSTYVKEFSGRITGPDNYPTCNLPAKIVTIGRISPSAYETFVEVEVFGSHRGYNPTSYFSYNKYVIMTGDKISSNLIASQGSSSNVDLWNGSLAGQYNNIDVTSGFNIALRVNPSCGAGINYTYIVRYYSGANFVPNATRNW